MEIKLQCGDTITIPEGCKAIVKGGCVVIEREQKFKDGDILVSVVNGKRCNAFIYKSTDKRGFHSYYVGIDVCGQLSISDSPSNRWSDNSLSYATEEEKQLLFDKMKEQGLKWNAKEKQVEKVRWRAILHDCYYFISTTGVICKAEVKSEEINTCNSRYDFFNQFRTEEQAEEGARRVKDTLMKYHEEIGEWV